MVLVVTDLSLRSGRQNSYTLNQLVLLDDRKMPLGVSPVNTITTYTKIAPGVFCLPIGFVNTYLVGEPGEPWILVDCGLPGCKSKILDAAEELFGGQAPAAIVLTHGHIDHIGAAEQLSNHWHTPVYTHPLEMPYITGKSGYPTPDPTVGGFMAQMSRVMPAGARTVHANLRTLPADGILPHIAGWRWIETPGHSPGHISLFREEDRVLLAGDAFATANVDSLIGAMTLRPQLWRSGSPFNCDWQATKDSVQKLAELHPLTLGCGHGKPMSGPEIPEQFSAFAAHYPLPAQGRYLEQPAITDENGVVSLPPAPPDPVPKIAAALALAVTAALLTKRRR